MKAPRLLVTLLSCGLSVPAVAQAPVVSVPSVDLGRYSGKWFEIASFPMFFQRNCVADTTAEYAPAADGGVTVHNRCRTNSGYDDAIGKATVVEGYGNSRLRVSFLWPFKADYWILGLDPEYRWVLSRTAQLPPTLLEAALAHASAQGFDLTKLRYTAQTSASKDAP
jgi:apolipoprotein D and lipocalin family protein